MTNLHFMFSGLSLGSRLCIQSSRSKAMFTLYRIGFCSVSNVAPVQCEKELIFCLGAEIVPKRFQRE